MTQPGVFKAPYKASPWEGNLVDAVDYTIGTETSNTITVSLQLKSGNEDLYQAGVVTVYVSTLNTGMDKTTVAGGWAIGTDGFLIPVVANSVATFVSEADGDIDIVLTDTGTTTYYLVTILPDGSLSVSDAVTFA